MCKLLYLTVICVSIFAATAQSSAQKSEPQKVFAPIKKELRAKIYERLRLFNEYERTRQFDKLYDLSFGRAVGRESKSEFIAWRQKTLTSKPENWFVDFIPESVDRKGDKLFVKSGYRIIGAALVRASDGSIYRAEGTIYARFREGEWYFSGFIISEGPPVVDYF
jgi:hypothetical protein